jgi:hypothetical protein
MKKKKDKEYLTMKKSENTNFARKSKNAKNVKNSLKAHQSKNRPISANKSKCAIVENVETRKASEISIVLKIIKRKEVINILFKDGLWYDATHPESMVLTMWDGLIKRYANQWNGIHSPLRPYPPLLLSLLSLPLSSCNYSSRMIIVIALDLKNEPWAATWGTGILSVFLFFIIFR